MLGAQDGKTYQKEIKSPEADTLLKKRIGETVSGDSIGLTGYELLITGGSDKCGFPMRKGIQEPRKRILIGKSVGFSGKDRNKNKQSGLVKRRTICGEMITKIIHQVNMKVVKAGKAPLGEAPTEEPKEAAPEDKKE